MTNELRSYTELSKIWAFADRYDYLRLKSQVGVATFGFDRWMNQKFYTSREWRQTRDLVIVRDNGCDLGVEGHEIYDRIYIHHMNPMTQEDIAKGRSSILDIEYLVCVTHRTHNAIHYGDSSLLRSEMAIRRAGDTKLW